MSGPRRILQVKEVNESVFGVGVGTSSLTLGHLIGRSCLLINLIFSIYQNKRFETQIMF